MKDMLSKRNSTVEGLRILSIFLIIMFHFCGRGLGLFDIYSYSAANLGVKNNNALLPLVMHSLGLLGVPIFLFFLGYYGIHFKANWLKDIVVQCFLYTFVFYIITLLPVMYANIWMIRGRKEWFGLRFPPLSCF